MNKDLKTTVREFVARISDGELEWLFGRLTQKLSGDLPEALNFMGRDREMDTLLGSASSADEFFTICDQVTQQIQQECRRKGLISSRNPVAA
jgi:hypothetical protein